MIGSIPANSAKKAPKKTIANTKMYWEILSSNRLKNHRAIRGNTKKTIAAKMMLDTTSRTQNAVPISPLVIPAIVASKISASTSVMIVPPIDNVTERILAIPYLLAIGYASNVCDANNAPIMNELKMLNPSTQ